MSTLNIVPIPYVSVPMGTHAASHQDLEAKIRNGIINSYVRSQAPLFMVGWVVLHIQEDGTLVQLERHAMPQELN